jgi:hypothetical protein
MIHGKGKRGVQANADGQDEKERAVMAENPKLSNRQMAQLIRDEFGICRGPEWVRLNRAE